MLIIKLAVAFVVWAVFDMIIESIWFMPKIFGEKWRMLNGYTAEQMAEINVRTKKAMPFMFIGGLIGFATTAIIFSLIGSPTVVQGAALGGLLALGYIGSKSMVDLTVSGKTAALWFIDVGYIFLEFVVLGVLLAVVI